MPSTVCCTGSRYRRSGTLRYRPRLAWISSGSCRISFPLQRREGFFPLVGILFFPAPLGTISMPAAWTISGCAGRYCPCRATISSLRSDWGNEEARNPFRIAGFIYPGSYLLSRDLSSDYHRRADVSLPGSEWDRVGPSGYDHQASACFVLLFRLPDYHLRLRVAFYFSAAGWHPRGLFCVLL